MSPEQKAAVSALVRLRREIAHDRVALEAHVADAQAALPDLQAGGRDRALRALAAVSLHAWYTGLETLLERVARQLDGEAPEGETCHRDLLFQITGDVPGVRPAVLSEGLIEDLIELLAFRHFFRHAYAVELDVGRLADQLGRLVRIHARVAEDLDAFDRFLAAAITEATA